MFLLGYTFFSLKKLYENKYFENKFCDFAVKYHGMGKFEVVSWRFTDGKCFRRIIGGLNNLDINYYEEWSKNINVSEPWMFKSKMYCIEKEHLFEIKDFYLYLVNIIDNNKQLNNLNWKIINTD